jgi:hypothetical protein
MMALGKHGMAAKDANAIPALRKEMMDDSSLLAALADS